MCATSYPVQGILNDKTERTKLFFLAVNVSDNNKERPVYLGNSTHGALQEILGPVHNQPLRAHGTITFK